MSDLAKLLSKPLYVTNEHVGSRKPTVGLQIFKPIASGHRSNILTTGSYVPLDNRFLTWEAQVSYTDRCRWMFIIEDV